LTGATIYGRLGAQSRRPGGGSRATRHRDRARATRALQPEAGAADHMRVSPDAPNAAWRRLPAVVGAPALVALVAVAAAGAATGRAETLAWNVAWTAAASWLAGQAAWDVYFFT